MYDVVRALPNHLTLQDKEMIKGRLLFFHQEQKDQKEIMKELRKEYPILTEAVITNIVTSPEYLETLLNTHKARRIADESKIWDAVVNKAMSGDSKMIELYFKMTGRLKEQVALSRGKDEPVRNVKELDDRELEIQFKQLAQRMDSQATDTR